MLCIHKRVVWYKTGWFCENGAILDFTLDTCEICSLVTRNNWPRVISNHCKLACVTFFVALSPSCWPVFSFASISKFKDRIFPAYKHWNFTGFVLWYYQRDWAFFSWASKLPRKCENKHCGADGRSFGRSVNGQVITKFSGMGTIYLPMALRRRARELHYNKS